MTKWIWPLLNTDDLSTPPSYWLYSSRFTSNKKANNHYAEWALSDRKQNFWTWVENNYPDFYSSQAAQKILDSKKNRTQYLKSIIRRAARFDRSLKKVGIYEDYWLEAMDARHRNKKFLKDIFKVWQSDEKSTLNLWQWLNYHKFDSIRTTYLNAYTRRDYLLTYDTEKGLIYRGNEKQPYDSTDLSMKDDSVMFVMDTNFNMYAGECHNRRFQHSSFLAGKPVLAAGMVKIMNGKIHSIDDHSGTYRVSSEHLQRALDHIPRSVFMDGCVVMSRTTPKADRQASKIIIHNLGESTEDIMKRLLGLLRSVFDKHNKFFHFLRFVNTLRPNKKQLSSLRKSHESLEIDALSYFSTGDDLIFKNFTMRASILIKQIAGIYIQAAKNATLKEAMLNSADTGLFYIANCVQYVFTFIQGKIATDKLKKARKHLVEDISIFEQYCHELLTNAEKKHDGVSSSKVKSDQSVMRTVVTRWKSISQRVTKPEFEDARSLVEQGKSRLKSIDCEHTCETSWASLGHY